MKKILITGGTGTFGHAFARHLLDIAPHVERIVIYSRDEQKQEAMARELAPLDSNYRLRFFIGDVRDAKRMHMAMRYIDTVVHAAALKIVPACEYNPVEAIRTNVNGAENVIRASIDCGVKRVIALSTDKAKDPTTLYGATKLAAERLFIAANHLSGSPGGNSDATRFSVVRYGNVANSRGSVIPLFKKIHAEGRPLPITHPEMTRFWITIDQAVAFVIQCFQRMDCGEIFIPRMPSFQIMDLAMAITGSATDWNFKKEIVGIRQGEKIHETLITPHDTRRLWETMDHFVISPEWGPVDNPPSDFTYSSDTNSEWLSVDDLRGLIK